MSPPERLHAYVAREKELRMSNSLWLALGIVLIVEGIGPLVAPKGWRAMIAQISEQSDHHLRRMGGCLVVAGAVIAYVFG